MITPTVLLMLKAPAEGAVKTRLAREIGPAAATAAYRALVEFQVRQIPDSWPIHICFAPADAEETMRAWLGERPEFSPQMEGDLGTRLARAAAAHFADHAGPLLLLGGDCPYLDSPTLQRAAEALSNTNAVLVPALDGGYCLLGLRAAEAHLFHEIAWSTEAVLEATRQRLSARGLSWKELPPLEDVDDAASWQRAQRAFPALGICA